MQITYATKIWQGDLDGLARHPQADLVIANNTHAKIVDIGKTDPYFTPEMEAVARCKTKYLLWYSGDVIPPETDWVREALQHLEKYPIVTCMESRAEVPDAVEVDGGYESYIFSDQCFIADSKFLKELDYETVHPISQIYPQHGGNSFERRVAQYLAANQIPLLILTNHIYHHITKEEK